MGWSEVDCVIARRTVAKSPFKLPRIKDKKEAPPNTAGSASCNGYLVELAVAVATTATLVDGIAASGVASTAVSVGRRSAWSTGIPITVVLGIFSLALLVFRSISNRSFEALVTSCLSLSLSLGKSFREFFVSLCHCSKSVFD